MQTITQCGFKKIEFTQSQDFPKAMSNYLTDHNKIFAHIFKGYKR